MRTMFKAVFVAAVAAVVGTSALASAEPCNDGDDVTAVTPAPTTYVSVPQPVITTQPAPIITHPIVYQNHWVNLSGGMRLRGEDVVTVGRDRGRFDKIEIVGGWGGGDTKVTKVAVTFGDGQVQLVTVDRKLTDRDDAVQIKLEGKPRYIKSVAIIGTSRGRSEIQVRGLEV